MTFQMRQRSIAKPGALGREWSKMPKGTRTSSNMPRLVDSAPRDCAHMSPTRPRVLIYTKSFDNSLVFAPPARAREISRLHSALRKSRTWAEFRRKLPVSEFEALMVRGFDNQGEPRPDPLDAFSPDFVPGFSDGDYPPRLACEMHTALPRSVLERFAERRDTVHNGPFWFISAVELRAIRRALQSEGWQVRAAGRLYFY